MLSEIINPFLNVRNKVKKEGRWVDQVEHKEKGFTKYGINESLVNDDLVVIDSLGKRVEIHSLHFSTNNRGNVFPQIFIKSGRKQNDNILRGVNQNGSGYYLTPLYINHSGNPYFENYVSSVDEGTSTILKRPIILPEGCQLVFSTTLSSNANITYSVYWTEKEVD